jgi:PHP family Zn ribbon phosphoesterase
VFTEPTVYFLVQPVTYRIVLIVNGSVDPIGMVQPIQRIIAKALEIGSEAATGVWGPYVALTNRFGNEYAVLLDASKEDMMEVVDPRIAEAIIRVRNDEAMVTPGYDGVYGVLDLSSTKPRVQVSEQRQHWGQAQLTDFKIGFGRTSETSS